MPAARRRQLTPRSAIERLLSSADVFIFLCHSRHALVFTAVSTSTRCAARSSRKTTMWNACSDAFHFTYTVHSNVQYISRRDPAPALNFKHDKPRDPPLVEFLLPLSTSPRSASTLTSTLAWTTSHWSNFCSGIWRRFRRLNLAESKTEHS